jgi:TRAP-type mannitol/chloroaromatic compound transport system substrate-binding protein
VIDAAEWVGPHDDMKLGLHNSARYPLPALGDLKKLAVV